MKKFILFLFLALTIFTISATGSKISPAIDVIANENTMIKASVPKDGEICFDTNDFDTSLLTTVNKITITSLPSNDCGRLMLDNLYVVKNQVIERQDFSMLKFVSTNPHSTVCFFTFEANDCDYNIECTLKSIESVNLSPTTTSKEAVSVWTQKDISYYGVLTGYDPESDNLKFEIVSYPKKGLLCLTDIENGDYIYTPYTNTSGTDVFTYRVVDSYGNYSNECKVTVKIEKLKTQMVYTDIENSKYFNAISVMVENELLNCSSNETLFNPSKTVTREEFLANLMQAMGAKNLPSVQKTRFADDSEISNKYKSYVEVAVSLGIISGTFESDGLHFYPKKEISLAEASVMINRIIGADLNNYIPTFKDSTDIPAWASNDISALSELGIICKENGKINPNSPLTKEQVANILMQLLRYTGKMKK